jgi:hypothetical protein
MAFLTAGRFMVTVAIAPFRSMSSSAVMWVL